MLVLHRNQIELERELKPCVGFIIWSIKRLLHWKYHILMLEEKKYGQWKNIFGRMIIIAACLYTNSRSVSVGKRWWTKSEWFVFIFCTHFMMRNRIFGGLSFLNLFLLESMMISHMHKQNGETNDHQHHTTVWKIRWIVPLGEGGTTPIYNLF